MTMDFLLIILIILLPLIAQGYISINYANYKSKKNRRLITGAQTAREILDRNGLTNVKVVEIPGSLTDHYDPVDKVVRLSSDIYSGTSISALSVAAHECGHAIQDSEGYVFLKFRTAIYPVVNFCSSIAYWIILIGFMLEFINLLYIGICFTFVGLLFQIITLPVEFDASSRAIKKVQEYGLVDNMEVKGCKKVLKAAAFTYVAGTLSSALQILRYILIARSRD